MQGVCVGGGGGGGHKILDKRIFIFGRAGGRIVKGKWFFKERPLHVNNYRGTEQSSYVKDLVNIPVKCSILLASTDHRWLWLR